jgi:hypothetical protein
MADCKPEVHCISGIWNEMTYRRNSNGYRLMFDHAISMVTLASLTDVGRLAKVEMMNCKPEAHCFSGMDLPCSKCGNFVCGSHSHKTYIIHAAVLRTLTIDDYASLFIVSSD